MTISRRITNEAKKDLCEGHQAGVKTMAKMKLVE